MRFLGRGGVGLVLVALAGVACSGADSEPTSPVSMTTPTVPATSTVPSVAADSTTSTSTTLTPTTSTSTTEPMSDEDAVLAVFEAYMGFEFDERTNGYGPSEERIDQYTTGALKQRALETLQARKDAEAFLVGQTTTRVESVTIDRDTAEVLICYLDTTSALFADGSVADPPSSEATLERLALERSGSSSWLVNERFAGGSVPCEL